jgi:hypothetical protein
MSNTSTIPHWTEGELPPEPCARQIADSISPEGRRVTTYEVRIWRAMLAEFNTHTLFSRNSASSRAIPLRKKGGGRGGTLDRLEDNGPAMPVRWPKEQPGMQGADEEVDNKYGASSIWYKAMANAIESAEALAAMGLHKSLANRLIEPFSWHVITVTAENWDGFFYQRSWNHTKQVQPEFGAVATQIEDIHNSTQPTLVEPGDFHTPYILDKERDELTTLERCKVSAARCARTSYLTHTNKRDVEEDFKLYERLATARPAHASPLQHVATPDPSNETRFFVNPVALSVHFYQFEEKHLTVPILGNYRGWTQLRHIVLGF